MEVDLLPSHDRRLWLDVEVMGKEGVCIERYTTSYHDIVYHSFGCPALDLMGYGDIHELLLAMESVTGRLLPSSVRSAAKRYFSFCVHAAIACDEGVIERC